MKCSPETFNKDNCANCENYDECSKPVTYYRDGHIDKSVELLEQSKIPMYNGEECSKDDCKYCNEEDERCEKFEKNLFLLQSKCLPFIFHKCKPCIEYIQAEWQKEQMQAVIDRSQQGILKGARG